MKRFDMLVKICEFFKFLKMNGYFDWITILFFFQNGHLSGKVSIDEIDWLKLSLNFEILLFSFKTKLDGGYDQIHGNKKIWSSSFSGIHGSTWQTVNQRIFTVRQWKWINRLFFFIFFCCLMADGSRWMHAKEISQHINYSVNSLENIILQNQHQESPNWNLIGLYQ